jgi:hypothetical protein
MGQKQWSMGPNCQRQHKSLLKMLPKKLFTILENSQRKQRNQVHFCQVASSVKELCQKAKGWQGLFQTISKTFLIQIK